MQLYQARLRDSGYFESAYVLPDEMAFEADPTAATVPIVVEVNERSSKRAVYGIGYSTDQGARAQVGFQHRNMLDRGWQLDSGVILEELRQRAYATMTTPTNPSGHYLAAGLRFESIDVQNERDRKNTLFAGRGYRSERLETSRRCSTRSRTSASTPATA